MTDALVIFARYPRLGRVKTRLASLLSAEGCLALHRAFLLDTLDRTADLKARRYLYLSECTDQEQNEFARRYSLHDTLIDIRPQKGTDLGDHLWNAYLEVSQEYPRVAFIGTDSPSLPTEYISHALTKLADYPVVVGPCQDGGYYLIGLSQSRPELFRDIQWGTSSVLEQTLGSLKIGEYALLPSWYDVDHDADLVRLRSDLETLFEGFPRRTAEYLRAVEARAASSPCFDLYRHWWSEKKSDFRKIRVGNWESPTPW